MLGSSLINEDECCKCHSEAYLNSNLKWMVSQYCQHKYCESCVNSMFLNVKEVPCVVCKTPLRRQHLLTQIREDQVLEKEIRIRKRILKDFNKRRDDFDSLREFNDYLEEVEDIIYNLVNSVNVTETKAKIDSYKQQHQALIVANQSKKADEDKALEAKLIEEEREQKLRKQNYILQEQQRQQDRLKEREEALQMMANGKKKTTTSLKRSSSRRNKEDNQPTPQNNAVPKPTPQPTPVTPATPSSMPPPLPRRTAPTPTTINGYTYQPQSTVYTPIRTPATSSITTPSSRLLQTPLQQQQPVNLSSLDIGAKLGALRAGGHIDEIVKKRQRDEAFGSIFYSAETAV